MYRCESGKALYNIENLKIPLNLTFLENLRYDLLLRISSCYRVHFGVDIIKLPGHGSSVMKRAPVVSSYEVKSFFSNFF